jgi:hypothetical protein
VGSLSGAGREDFSPPVGGDRGGAEAGVFNLECLDLLAGVFGLAAPLGSAAIDVGDALSGPFEFELEVGVFGLPEIAAAAEEPGLDLLRCGVGGLSIRLGRVSCGVHV